MFIVASAVNLKIPTTKTKPVVYIVEGTYFYPTHAVSRLKLFKTFCLAQYY